MKNPLSTWLRERRNKKRAIQYIREGNAEIKHAWDELLTIYIEAQVMAVQNQQERALPKSEAGTDNPS